MMGETTLTWSAYKKKPGTWNARIGGAVEVVSDQGRRCMMGLPISHDEAYPLSISVQLLHSMSWDVQIVRCYPRGRRVIEAQQTVFGGLKHAQQVGEALRELVKIRGENDGNQ